MKNRWVRISSSVLVTVLFFYYFYNTVDFGEIGKYLKTVRWGWLAVAAGAYCLTYPVRAFRIYYLTRNSGNCSFLQIQKICFRHQFYGRIIPFKVGDLSLVYLLRKTGVSVGEGGAVLLLIRLFDGVLIIFSFLLCNLFVNMTVIPNWILLLILALAVSSVFLIPVLLFRCSPFLQRLSEKLYCGIEQIRVMMKQSVATTKNFLVIGLVSFVMWFFVYLSMHGVVLAFSQPISFFETVVASFLASAAAFLPINGIGGFGMVETGWTLGFTLLGMEHTAALSSGVVSNTMSFLIICLFGIISYITGNRRSKNV